MADLDVTSMCRVGQVYDEENVTVLKCACGVTYGRGEVLLSVYRDAEPMTCCGRRLYVSVKVHVLEVIQ